MSTCASTHPALRLALGLGAVAQAIGAAVWFAGVAPRIPHDVALLTAAHPPAPPNEAMAAFRALPELLRDVPLDAPVLVVSTLLSVQLEYYVLPRPMRLLQALPDAWIRLAEEHAPQFAPEVARRRQRLDDRGALLTEARLVAAIAGARFVLVAGAAPPELAPLRPRLVPRVERAGFALFAVP